MQRKREEKKPERGRKRNGEGETKGKEELLRVQAQACTI